LAKKPESIVQQAHRMRHLSLLQKVRSGRPLTAREIAELEVYEANADAGDIPVPQPKRQGRPPTLTVEIAAALEEEWIKSGDVDLLTDREIAARVGVSDRQLANWLDRNTKVTWANGDREGLRDIRVRAKAVTKANYLTRLLRFIDRAERMGDMKTAGKLLLHLMERQFPKDFGSRADHLGAGESPTELVRGMIREVHDCHQLIEPENG